MTQTRRLLYTSSGTGIAVPQHFVDLSWNASTSQVVGYNVYRGTQSGGPYIMINSVLNASTNFGDNNVQAGHTYFYVVTAVDASNNERQFLQGSAGHNPDSVE